MDVLISSQYFLKSGLTKEGALKSEISSRLYVS